MSKSRGRLVAIDARRKTSTIGTCDQSGEVNHHPHGVIGGPGEPHIRPTWVNDWLPAATSHRLPTYGTDQTPTGCHPELFASR